MKIVLASPNFPQLRGNTVTVQRIATHLEKLGAETEIVSTTDDKTIGSFPSADIVHGFHAYNFYQFLQKLEKKPVHYIVTITGTDLNQDLFNPERRADVLASLRGAKAVHVFDEKAKSLLVKEIPELADKTFVLPQGNQPSPAGSTLITKEPESFVFFLPAGIRKVKNIPAAISMLHKLQLQHPQLRLWLVGPVLEEKEGEAVMELVNRHKDWIRYLGQVPHEDMGSVYRQADVVLNTSLSEGQPATILEAMGYALPVLASDIPGNSGILVNEEIGFLYKNQNEFLDYAGKLMNNNKIRQSIGQSAEAYVKQHHSSEREAETLLKVYQRILK